MAGAAEQPIVLQAAFAPAVGNGHDVIGFPARPCGAPRFPRRAVACGRLRPRPFTMGLDDVEAAEPAGALVAFLDLLAHVPWTAADLPFVYAFVPAERPARCSHRSPAPAADWLTCRVALRNAPQSSAHDARATSAHVSRYRSLRRVPLLTTVTDGFRPGSDHPHRSRWSDPGLTPV
jgi:hypothetical protein